MTPRPRLSRRRHRALLPVAILASLLTVGLAACGRTNTGIGRLTFAGQVTVTPANGSGHDANTGSDLHAGDRVVVTSGEAAISLHGGVLQLRAGTDLVVNAVPHLTEGSVLIEPTGSGLRVDALRAALFVPKGIAELSVGPVTANLTAKVYVASAQLDIAGNPVVRIAAPRQITLTPDTRLPVSASPLKYQENDPWDHMYLATAENISGQLAAAASGFNAQLAANQGKDASFYQQLLPALNARSDFVAAFYTVQHGQPVAGAPAPKPADYLIAAAIGLRARGDSFVNHLNDELTFYAQGAPWGFVAYDQGVTDFPSVLNDVLGAIGRASLPITGAPASQIAIGPPPAATTTTTRPARPATTPTTVVRRPAVTPTTTTTTVPNNTLQTLPPVPAVPGILGSLLNPLLDPLLQALSNILGGHH